MRKRKQAEIHDRRVLQQEMVQLIAYAFHEPQNIPDLTAGASAKPDLGDAANESGPRLWAAFLKYRSNQGS